MRLAGHVAVVDDSPDSLQMLVAYLRSVGLKAAGGMRPSVPNRVPAFLAHPAVVVYDVSPPYEMRLEEFRTFRAIAFPDVPVILTTTQGQLLRRWLKKDEVTAVFSKPCDLAGMLAVIREAMGRDSGGTSS